METRLGGGGFVRPAITMPDDDQETYTRLDGGRVCGEGRVEPGSAWIWSSAIGVEHQRMQMLGLRSF